MAHEITITNGKAEMAFNPAGGATWHGLGNPLTADAPLEQWREESGLGFHIARTPVRFSGAVGDDGEADPNGEADLSCGGRDVLFRTDTKHWLGIVSKSYRIVQPYTVLEFFRTLTEEHGLQMETAGTLHGGRRYWALAKFGEAESILGRDDLVGKYLLLASSADLSLATQGRDTTIRVVCNNTLTAATNLGEATFRLPHNRAFDIEAAHKAMGFHKAKAEERFARTMDTFRKLAQTPVTAAETLRMTLEAFGFNPAEMSKDDLKKAAERPNVATIGRMAVTGNGLIGAELPGSLGTAWGWLNSVTQFFDHAAGKTPDNRLASAWFGEGERTKRRALQIAGLRAGIDLSAVEDDGAAFEGELVDAA